MSGIFFDLPSVRFIRRFRFLEPMLQTIAASLFRWLSAPVCALRQVHFRHDEAEFPSASQSGCKQFDEAEFPSASQSGCKQFDWTLDDSRAADRVPNLFGALRPFNHWTKIKDKHELLFSRKTLPPLARGGPTQSKSRTLSRSTGSSEDAEKNILATGYRIFRKRRGEKKNSSAATQWFAALATVAQTRAH